MIDLKHYPFTFVYRRIRHNTTFLSVMFQVKKNNNIFYVPKMFHPNVHFPPRLTRQSVQLNVKPFFLKQEYNYSILMWPIVNTAVMLKIVECLT